MSGALRRLALLGLALGAACAHGAEAPGTAAPSFVLDGRAGPVSLAAYRGKYVYLDFWASWCGPCKRSFPWMDKLQQRFGQAGLQVVAINVDLKRADAEQFLAETPANFVIAFDPSGATARQYAIKGMPSSVLIGPDGTVMHMQAGFNAESAASLEQEIAAFTHGGAP